MTSVTNVTTISFLGRRLVWEMLPPNRNPTRDTHTTVHHGGIKQQRSVISTRFLRAFPLLRHQDHRQQHERKRARRNTSLVLRSDHDTSPTRHSICPLDALLRPSN